MNEQYTRPDAPTTVARAPKLLDRLRDRVRLKRYSIRTEHVYVDGRGGTYSRLLLNELSGTMGLIAGLLYGSGMRLLDGLRLRAKDVEFERREIVVRDGKGG